MLKRIFETVLGIFRSRIIVLGVLFAVLMGILVHRVFQLQIVNGEEYLNTFTYRIRKDIELASPRGSIFDVNGVALAHNKLSYNVMLEDSTLLSDNETKNQMISRLIALTESCGSKVNYNLPLSVDEAGRVIFSSDDASVIRFKKDVYSTEDLSASQRQASAREVYEYMRSDRLFALADTYELDEALKILSVRFDLFLKRYEKYLSVPVATQISDTLAHAIMENSDQLPGVSIEQDYTRVYEDSKYFSGITGYIGPISEEEYAEKESQGDSNYSRNDLIGKTGIESYYEEELKGTKGSQTLYVNSVGSVLEVTEEVKPKGGNDIYLSIDSQFQKEAYDLIEERIAGILLQYMASEVDPDYNPDCYIPVRDYYYALIKNNIISLSHIKSEEATELEKSFYEKYLKYQEEVRKQIPSAMRSGDKDLSKEYSSYISMAYQMLRDRSILNISALDDSDQTLAKWQKREISFRDLINYAISKNIVDLEQIEDSDAYLDMEEVYAKLENYIVEELSSYTDYEKQSYYYMLSGGSITGREICLLLYEQGVLPMDSLYDRLLSGDMDAMGFMYNKIYYLQITPDMLGLEPCSGSFVLTDVKTGQVRALVSYPGYDSNRISDPTYFSAMLANSSAPFFNHATQQTLAPGSTYKMIPAIAGIEENVVSEGTYIYDNTEFKKVEPSASCWSPVSHGDVNVVTAIEHSCNYYFYELGWRMGMTDEGLNNYKGLEILNKYTRMFGLDEKAGLEISEAEPHVSDESIVRSCIGQGTHNYTAAQLNRYVTAVANSGTLFRLTLVDKITEPGGKLKYQHEPEVESKIKLSPRTWELIHQGMYLVCNESSYNDRMSGLGITMAGKSGTAQIASNIPDHGLFVGYAPYDSPEVAGTLIIPNAHGSGKVLDLYADLICNYYGLPMKNQGIGERTENEESPSETEEQPVIEEKIRTANMPIQSGLSD